MAQRTVYVPLYNLSFNSGRLNPSGLIRADGVIHGGESYVATPPFFDPLASQLTDIAESQAIQPFLAHVNLSPRTSIDGGSVPWSLWVYADGEFYEIEGSSTAAAWPITACSPVTPITSKPASDEGQFVSFGQSIIFACGRNWPVQIMLNDTNNFQDCFISSDKPKFKYVAVIGQRLVFANAGNTGTAGSPDPNGSLLWWGASNDPRVIGNPESHPRSNTDFQSILDDQGDITGLSSGKDLALVLKSNAIYRLEIGGPFGFQVPRVAAGIGCKYPRSITELGEDTYFWSTLGPAVFRDSQVFLLGDGAIPLRDLFADGPPDPQLAVISSAADIENGLVSWLISYKSYAYTYALDADDLPTETEGASTTTYALVVYNAIANQLSFAWRHQSADGIQMVREAAPSTNRRFLPLCLVDRIPWRNTFPLAGIGMIGIESSATDPVGPRTPKMFLAGLSSQTSYAPEWTVGQAVILTTGFIPIQGFNGRVVKVRPILRSKRAKAIPEMSVYVRTCLSPSEPEREFGPFLKSTGADDRRNGFITCQDVASASFVSIELQIAARQTTPEAYAFMLAEIEGVEIVFADTGKAT